MSTLLLGSTPSSCPVSIPRLSMDKCAATKPNGERCGARAIGGSACCWNHAPEYAAARKRNAAKGGKTAGRGRPQTETAAIKTLLEGLTNRVLEGEVETGRAAVANQLINTRLRTIELERKIKETEELEARLEELEASLEQRTGA
jgi:hypothetical protein